MKSIFRHVKHTEHLLLKLFIRMYCDMGSEWYTQKQMEIRGCVVTEICSIGSVDNKLALVQVMT